MIIVHYGDFQTTEHLLATLDRLNRGEELDVVIVNNGPGEHFERMVDRDNNENLPRIYWCTPPFNNGYFGGAAHGLNYYKDRFGCIPDWIIIANNDVILPDEHFLQKLLRKNFDEIGVIAPRVISNKTLIDQNPFLARRPGRLKIAEWRFWLGTYKRARLRQRLSAYKQRLRRLIKPRVPIAGSSAILQRFIYAPHGSFFILSRKYFERGGSLSHGAFLFGEELTVAENCRRIELPVVYHPELFVLHNEHTAVGNELSRASYERHREAFKFFTTCYFPELQND